MEEQVKEPTQAGASSVDSEKNTAEVTFGETKYTIHRAFIVLYY